MFSMDDYLARLLAELKETFGTRLLYVGLQGSYQRGEADEQSDIDVMAVLDTLSVSDLDRYRDVLAKVGETERACGFLCGREELSKWNPCEVCHLLHTTEDKFGSLSALVPSYTAEDVKTFVKISLGNLYHALCHRYVHADAETNCSALPGAYKGVFFILQNLYYQKTGVFIRTKRELFPRLSDADRAIMEKAEALRREELYDFHGTFRLLFEWCQNTLLKI